MDQPTEYCEARHQDDPTPCVGADDAVVVLDRQGVCTWGCEWHGARLLASLDGGRVHPGSSEDAAIRAYTAAQSLAPFEWMRTPRTTEPRSGLWAPLP